MTGNTPARITVIVGSLNRGGCENHLLQVLPRLDRARFAPEVFTLTERGELATDMEARGVPVRESLTSRWKSRTPVVRLARLALVSLELFSHLLRHRPKIVHCFLPGAYLIGAPVSLAAGVRNRLMSRRSLNDYQRRRPFAAKFERRLHSWMTAIIGNSRQVVAQLCHEGVATDRIALIYNGVDADVPMAKRDSTTTLTTFVIVANLIPYKGHKELLTAFAELVKSGHEDCRLMVVGRDDGYGVELRAMTGRLDIAEKVVFLGERDDVPLILETADVGLLTSYEEGFPNAVLEYMAAGLPVIVTDASGSAEAVQPGVTGVVVPVGAVADLRDAMAKLALNAELRERMGAAGRQAVIDGFSVQSCVEKYELLYSNVMDGVAVHAVPELAIPGEHHL